ncbi:uncharacterized protein LOC113337535 [Papaver somniferum]|uniref:uncharacterized protein LOC113337535 n=1 Tax=Papaver somniferum TaxID=3469 RepID=UPI000E6F4C6E|nr:uncharacterized protein LOC113337535 [Papaver somniferum]
MNITTPLVVSMSSHMITVSVGDVLVSGVHAHVKKVQRRFLWSEMELISDLKKPWIALGDFNAITSQEEKIGGKAPNKISLLDFTNCLNNCELIQAPKTGVQHSWSNCQHGNRRILCNLDKVVINQQWLQLYEDWGYKVGLRVASDHAPLLGGCASIPKPKNVGHSSYISSNKETLDKLVEAQDELANRETQESTLLKAKSRIKWVKEGSTNTGFFHANLKITNARNSISELEESSGNIISNQGKIAEILVKHFEDKFSARNVTINQSPLNVIPTVITDEGQLMLDAIPDSTEIKSIVFYIDPDSSPGRDGYSGIFYRTCWDIIKDDLVAYIKGRNIHEQVLLASELANEMKKKRRGGNVGLKLDISQAYDSVSWEFLIAVLKMSRGLRQGDPLSPILFVLMEDVLRRNLTHLVNTKAINPMVKLSTRSKANALWMELLKPGKVKLQECIPIYNMAVYKWHASVIKVCEKIIRNFLWSGDSEVRKCKTISWKRVCTPYKEGGLGIRRLEVINRVLLMKMMWKILNSKEELALFFQAKYKDKNGQFTSKWKMSSVWPGLKWAWNALKDDVRWCVGDGTNIYVWFETWIGETPLINQIGEIPFVKENINMKVSELLNGTSWKIPVELQSYINNTLYLKLVVVQT